MKNLKNYKEFINEGIGFLKDYFKNMWSKDIFNNEKIKSNKYLFDKYSKYLDPDFDWDILDESDLKKLWDDWDIDDREIS